MREAVSGECADSRNWVSPVFAQLVPVDGGVPITIDRDVCVIGRQREGCDVVVERKSVSKMHCILVKTDGLLFVRDLFSTNGTKVNGQRITRGALLPGDTLSLAGEKFRIHLGPSPAASESANNDHTVEMVIPDEDESFGNGDLVANGHNQVSEGSAAGMKFVRLPPGGIALDTGHGQQ